MAIDKKFSDFKDHLKVAVIIAVYPQTRTVDVKYTSQDGQEYQLLLPYTNVSGTWGSVYMPIIGDRVLIDNSMGEVPIIKTMVPLNSDYLPYLDPGEIGHQSESGSFIHVKNRRKRVMSTNQLIDYDATTGPNGETDIELEAGGVILRARSKQMQDQTYSQFDDHAHIAVFDNGDIVLQSMNKNIPKGLLHFDGMSGHSWWHAGDSKVQEYIELNPVKQEIVVFSDGDLHLFSKNDQKISTYGDQIVNVCGAWQFKVGIPPENIPADFDLIILDNDLNDGDIRIDNSIMDGAIFYLHINNDVNILSDTGDIDISTTMGDINITCDDGAMNLSTTGDDITIQTDSDINITGSTVTVSAPSGSFNAVDAKGLPNLPGVSNVYSYLDGVAGQMSHVAPLVGLGALASDLKNIESNLGISLNLPSVNDIKSFEGNLFTQRLNDIENTITATFAAMAASGVPNLPSAGAAIAQLASLAHIPIPSGSSNVKVNM